VSTTISQPAGPSQVRYTVGGAAQQDFAVPFQFDDILDLEVFVGGVPRAQGTFSLIATTELDGIFTAATLRLSASVSNITVVINRSTRIQQQASFPTSGLFSTRVLNAEIARVWQSAQDLFRRFTNVARYPDDEAAPAALPSVAARANRLLGFDAQGNPIAAGSFGGATVTPFMSTVLDDATAADACATLEAFRTAGGTLTGNVRLTASSGLAREIFWQTGSTNRWVISKNADPETSVNNEGSNLVIGAFSDAGSYLGNAVTVGRGTLVCNFLQRPTHAGVPLASQPQAGAGVGQFLMVGAGDGAAYVLPAGGTWVYALNRLITSSGGIVPAARVSGEAAGGTTVGAALAGHQWNGIAWRKA
jgi:hypothetical protein